MLNPKVDQYLLEGFTHCFDFYSSGDWRENGVKSY